MLLPQPRQAVTRTCAYGWRCSARKPPTIGAPTSGVPVPPTKTSRPARVSARSSRFPMIGVASRRKPHCPRGVDLQSHRACGWLRPHCVYHLPGKSALGGSPRDSVEKAFPLVCLELCFFLPVLFPDRRNCECYELVQHSDTAQNVARDTCPQGDTCRPTQFWFPGASVRCCVVLRKVGVWRRAASGLGRNAREILPRCLVHRPGRNRR